MTITVEPITLSTLVVVLIAIIGGFVWIGKLGSRVDRLESDVKDLKDGQKQILELLNQHIGYHQGLQGASTGAN